ncbi:hypothetical protein ACHAXT_006672 [Thalassiosira profunda]
MEPPPQPSAAATWVDRLRMEPLPIGGASSPLEFNVASLNVLAESYLTPRSHPGLPQSYADVAFNPAKRRKLLLDTLGRFCGPNATATEKWEVLALQELDLLQPGDPILPAFETWGYGVVRTPGEQRKDCCAIAYDKRKFTLVRSENVMFDDLATLQSNASNNEDEGSSGVNQRQEGYGRMRPKKPNSPSELTGMVRSFLRRNGAVAAYLESKETGQSIVVASVHLYWHPGYEYVKLCQAKYLLDRVAAFAEKASPDDAKNGRIPTIICGDTNSKPGSIVHKLFIRPHVDARTVAPWRYVWDRDSEEMYTEDEENAESVPINGDRRDGQDEIAKEAPGGYIMEGLPSAFTAYCGLTNSSAITKHAIDLDAKTNGDAATENGDSVKRRAMYCGVANSEASTDPPTNDNSSDDADLEETLETRRLKGHITPQDYQHATPPLPVKYMLDYTLNRFTRWLRILGIDAILETVEEENERTSGGNIALFHHCKEEQRTLLTTSYKLLLRKDCPPGAYLLDPKSSADLERAMPRLLRTHGVELSPCTFLTRCVVCNGNIHPVTTDDEKRAVFLEHGAPGLVDSDEIIEVFRCDKCLQGYWWDDRPSSSASRVFSQATKLLRLCLRGGVGLKDEKVADEKKRKVIMGAFDFVDVAKERRSEDSVATETERELTVIEWLREPKLDNPFRLRSAYAAPDSMTRESPPFTNVTKEFVGCLDYIFYEHSQFDLVGRLKVPTSFREMNASGAASGHLIPSDIWPSDHVAVGARLRLKDESTTANKEEDAKQNRSAAPPAAHPAKCGCGCVPQILSLFEMAELRKKARQKKAAEAAANLSN